MVAAQWKFLWAEFYNHIIYVKWEPRDNFQRIVYNQVQAQQDYIHYFPNIAKYTLFIDVDELLFSPTNQNLGQFMDHYSQNRISSVKFAQRHFMSRFCSKKQKMTDIFYYFP